MLLEIQSKVANAAIEFAASSESKELILLGQSTPNRHETFASDLFRIGVRARLQHNQKITDSTVRVQLQNIERVKVKRLEQLPQAEAMLVARFRSFPFREPAKATPDSLLTGIRYSYRLLQEYLILKEDDASEKISYLNSLSSDERLVFVMLDMLEIANSRRMKFFSAPSLSSLIASLSRALSTEIELLRTERRIDRDTLKSISKNQTELFLRERIKSLHRELGDDSDDEFNELLHRIRSADLPDEIAHKAEKEARRVKRGGQASAESAVALAWLDCVLSLPWGKQSKDTDNLVLAANCLDNDHFGLQDVKERILDYIAVMIRVGEPPKAPILCLVGPPGVGKTSLGRSISQALNRSFARIALGGVHDEAEIRGHRRAYIGATPGRIIQAIQKSGTSNPVILLDEVDKMSRGWNGDPAAALLEVLDPEQNNRFCDNFLGIEFDLSHVLFITTANSYGGIPETLRDRMEIIRLPGYLEPEKLTIAERFLIPKQLGLSGVPVKQVEFREGTISAVIRGWTREAGVRDLERRLARIARKLARKEWPLKSYCAITPDDLAALLGSPQYTEEDLSLADRVGVAAGLAFTGTGGELLEIEVSVVPGRGRLQLTGTLGEVIKESAAAALSYVRARADELGLPPDFYRSSDIHIHLPAGATPKDGPSAGIALATALVSALTGAPVRGDIAMTGEITLRGRVLSVGGIREKGVAAHRYRLKHVIIPHSNQRDLNELPLSAREGVTWHFVKTMDEVLSLAFERWPIPRKARKLSNRQMSADPLPARKI